MASAEPESPVTDGVAPDEATKRRHHHRGYNHRAAQKPKRKSKRQFLREILLYALALGAFGAFLKWISEDHQSAPPPQ